MYKVDQMLNGAMTVAELVEHLKTLPQEAKVLIANWDYEHTKLVPEQVTIQRAYISPGSKFRNEELTSCALHHECPTSESREVVVIE